MITFSSEAQAKLTQTHIIELLQKAKLCKTANKFVECLRLKERYVVYIPTLQFHGYCMRYKKYKGNESLKDLVTAHATEYKLSVEDTNLLIEALNTK